MSNYKQVEPIVALSYALKTSDSANSQHDVQPVEWNLTSMTLMRKTAAKHMAEPEKRRG